MVGRYSFLLGTLDEFNPFTIPGQEAPKSLTTQATQTTEISERNGDIKVEKPATADVKVNTPISAFILAREKRAVLYTRWLPTSNFLHQFKHTSEQRRRRAKMVKHCAFGICKNDSCLALNLASLSKATYSKRVKKSRIQELSSTVPK